MTAQLVALGIFVAVFAIGAIRNVNIGIVMFPFAAAVGLSLADMALEDVIGGFPLSILVLLVGVTYFFGIAHSNGTIEWVVAATIAKVSGRDRLYPLVFFLLTAMISAMGAPLGGLVVAPVGMTVAARRGLDPMLMALAMGTGLSAGAFMPTSLFGIITWGTADAAGIELSPMLLAAVAIIANLILLAVAYLLFGRGTATAGAAAETVVPAGAAAGGSPTGRPLSRYGQSSLDVPSDAGAGAGTEAPAPLTRVQLLTLVAIVLLVATVVVLSITGHEPDIGVLGFAFAALLAVVDPDAGKSATSRIDWGSVLLVGGIITYVEVLTEMGVLDMLGESAAAIGTPLLAAVLLCAVAGLVSAFASTTGMLAALVPLALPLIGDSSIPGWAMICAIGVCSSIVDVSPFSTVGATYVAAAEEADRPRMTKLLSVWGLSMVVIGPLALTLTLIIPGMVLG